MSVFYCKCLKCNHTGNVNLPTEKHGGTFVCSKCGSKEFISVYRDMCSNNSTHHNIVKSYDAASRHDTFYDDLYEEKMFEEERQVDTFMMAPTGWEDDEEIQSDIGVYNSGAPNSGDVLDEGEI